MTPPGSCSTVEYHPYVISGRSAAPPQFLIDCCESTFGNQIKRAHKPGAPLGIEVSLQCLVHFRGVYFPTHIAPPPVHLPATCCILVVHRRGLLFGTGLERWAALTETTAVPHP